MGEGPHALDAPLADFSGKHRPKAIPPEAHRLMAAGASALVQQVLDIPQREREADTHHPASRMISGLVLKSRKGLCLRMLARLGAGTQGLNWFSSDNAYCCAPPTFEKRAAMLRGFGAFSHSATPTLNRFPSAATRRARYVCWRRQACLRAEPSCPDFLQMRCPP
jgi:hypothetical protein